MGEVPVRPGLFAVGPPPRLFGGRCPDCARHHFPAATVCPYCGVDRAEQVDLSPAGRLWAWTAVNTPPPGYHGDVPYGFGVVELPEGLRVVTRLTESDPTRLRPGQPMRLVTVPAPGAGSADGTDALPAGPGQRAVTYAFAPEPPQ